MKFRKQEYPLIHKASGRSTKEMAARYLTRSMANSEAPAAPRGQTTARSSSHPETDRQLSGSKRSSSYLPPLAPPSASQRKLARQPSDSCVSGVSSASGSAMVPSRANPQGTVLTPTSRALAEVTSYSELPLVLGFSGEHQASHISSAIDGQCEDICARSPSITDITFQSSGCMKISSAGVKCDEQLDDEEEDARECAQSEALFDDRVNPEWKSSPGNDLSATPPSPLNTCLANVALDSTGPTDVEGRRHESASLRSYEQGGSYEPDIFQNLRQHEILRKPAWGYLETKQKDLIVDHRRIMVNWLVEFAEEFSLEPETLFLCVAILDQFLLRGPPVKKGSLQLLGTACMLIAVKFQESHPPNMMQSCCAAAEGSFMQDQVVSMEALVLKTIGYSCAIPTAQTFLWHHLKESNPEPKLEKFAEYFAMLSLSEYALLRFYPSALSAASILLGGIVLGREPTQHLTKMRCEYSFGDLKPIMRVILDLHRQSSTSSHLSSIRRRFLREQNLSVAAIELPCQIPVEKKT